MKPRYLHIYGQDFQHTTAYIVGNRVALVALRRTIDRVLSGPSDWLEEPFEVTDGEGYMVRVALATDEEIMRYRYPYTDAAAQDNRPGVKWPGEEI